MYPKDDGVPRLHADILQGAGQGKYRAGGQGQASTGQGGRVRQVQGRGLRHGQGQGRVVQHNGACVTGGGG